MRQIVYILLLIVGVQGFVINQAFGEREVRRYWEPRSSQASDGVELAGQTNQVQQQPLNVQSTLGDSSLDKQRLYPSVGSLNFLEAFNNQSSVKVRRRRRKLWRMPTVKVDNKTQLACGSAHIRDYRSDAYMHEVSACMLAGAAQEWRRTMCPMNTPDCQLMFGDMSYGKKKPHSWPHKTHKMGHCVDVWPIRKPGEKGEKSYKHSGYDQKRTIKLVEIFKKWGSDTTKGGGRQVLFNDPKLIAMKLTRVTNKERRSRRKVKPHDDHIHICFRPTKESKKKCEETKFDPLLCPELATPNQYEQHLAYVKQLDNPNTSTSVF